MADSRPASGIHLFDRFDGHEQVVFASDPDSGLRAIIALHSTALGPALGGTRFHAYPDDASALDDVLQLSKAMSYKNALAGLPHGGGKAVILGDPQTVKTDALLEAYGRAVESLAGRYYTACDVGTYVADMDVIARTTRYVTGRSEAKGGGGDSSLLTALGVFCGIRACAQHRWGSDDLSGRRAGISGVGKVGHRLVAHLLEAGASVVIFDVDGAAIDAVLAAHPGVEVAASEADLVARPDIDIYSPNALGGALNDATVAAAGRDHRLRRREQPARSSGHRAAAGRPRHRLCPRLPGQLRGRHPGGRRDERLRSSSGPEPAPSASTTSRSTSCGWPMPKESHLPRPPTGWPRRGSRLG